MAEHSFIARNQDVRSDAATTTATSWVYKSAVISEVDQRFGVGGDCAIVKAIGIPWTFNWGGRLSGGTLLNEQEIQCATGSGGKVSVMLTVGHADHWDETNGIWDSLNDQKYNLTEMKKGKPALVLQAYASMEKLLDKYPTAYNRVKILANVLQIPEIASKYPNAYWQIANEPDWVPYFRPNDYAEYYLIFSKLIQAYQPTAKIGIGGLAWPRYNHEKKWATSTIDWSLWRNITADFGSKTISSEPITALSIMKPVNNGVEIKHLTRGGKVYKFNPSTNVWDDETANFNSVGSGGIGSFYQRLENGVQKKWLVKGGELWAYPSSSNGWELATSAISIGAGPIKSFSVATNEQGKKVQYVVRCQADKWNNATKVCATGGIKLYYRSEKPSGGGFDAWADLSQKFDLVGGLQGGDFNYFVQYLDDAQGTTRSQYLARNGKLFFRSGRKYQFNKELVDDPYIKSLSSANPANANLYKQSAWFLLFLKRARELTSNTVPLDFVNIHPYAWTNHNTGGGGYTDSTIESAIADSKSSIQSMYNVMKDTKVNLSQVPLIITEFSHAGDKVGGNCETVANCEAQSSIVSKYIQGLVGWLKQNPDMVHKWIWFYAGPHSGTALSGKTNLQQLGTQLMYLLPNSTTPNKTAQVYKDMMASSRDSVVPQITKISNMADRNKYPIHTLTVVINEPNQTSGAYEYWYCLGKQAGACDLQAWSSSITKAKSAKIIIHQTPGYLETRYVSVKVTDSAGNVSQTFTGDLAVFSHN